jgi:predicted dehydrogenase
MCEKPIGLNAREALALSKLAKEAEAKAVVCMTAFTYRFSPAIRFLKQLIDEGKLGTIRHFRSQRYDISISI